MIKDDIKKILVTEEQIEKRCEELGKMIDRDYEGVADIMLVGILKGSVPFMAELIKHIESDIQIDFMAASSYSGTESLGDIKIVKDLDRVNCLCKSFYFKDISAAFAFRFECNIRKTPA